MYDSIGRTHHVTCHGGLRRLADDLRTGRWHASHADLIERDSLDAGYRVVIAAP